MVHKLGSPSLIVAVLGLSVATGPAHANLIGWAVGQKGTILQTTDEGASWKAQTSGTTEFLLAVEFLDANNGWVVGTQPRGGTGTILSTPFHKYGRVFLGRYFEG